MPALCRDCFAIADTARPPARPAAARASSRIPELLRLTIAHIDCDAFYASVEKRDRPELASRPVIVGGGVRGVVTAACYVARMYGVRSAMPMFKALKACPDAVVIRPDFAKYIAASRQVRALMAALTPLVQPLSIDEAVLDLAGTEALHGAPPAVGAGALRPRAWSRRSASPSRSGWRANRLLAKIAAGRDKPRGFAVIGAAEAASLLAPEPVRLLPGIGPVLARKLETLGITRLGQLQVLSIATRCAGWARTGPRWSAAPAARMRGWSTRPARPSRSAPRRPSTPTSARSPTLERHLWRLAEKLARRLKENDLAAAGVVLKLKTAQFATRTRAARLPSPTVLPDRLFAAARDLLVREATGTAFRLIGIGASPWCRATTPIVAIWPIRRPRGWRRRRRRSTRCGSVTGRAAIGRGRGLGGGTGGGAERDSGGAGGTLTCRWGAATSPASGGRGFL